MAFQPITLLSEMLQLINGEQARQVKGIHVWLFSPFRSGTQNETWISNINHKVFINIYNHNTENKEKTRNTKQLYSPDCCIKYKQNVESVISVTELCKFSGFHNASYSKTCPDIYPKLWNTKKHRTKMHIQKQIPKRLGLWKHMVQTGVHHNLCSSHI